MENDKVETMWLAKQSDNVQVVQANVFEWHRVKPFKCSRPVLVTNSVIVTAHSPRVHISPCP